MSETARFIDGDTEFEFDRVVASDGQIGYDASGFLNRTGNLFLDPAFVNTASCDSKITYIDGDNGVLRYRGYPIEQLARHSTYLETAYLVIYGELPTASELQVFEERIRLSLIHI